MGKSMAEDSSQIPVVQNIAADGPRRRDILLGAAAATASLSLTLPSAAETRPLQQAAKIRPNIVFMLVDNMGYGDLSCYAGPIRGVPTPRIDKLAREGIQLTNFNVEPECTPSRSALMTGRMPIRSGTSSVVMTGGKDGLSPWEYTIAELLSDAGYATAHYGKWHLGSNEGRFPTDQGFDEWYGIPRSTGETMWLDQPGYDPAIYTPEPVLEGKKGEKTQFVRVYDTHFRPFIDREIANRSAAYIKKQAKGDKPFFLYIPFTHPHEPPLAHPDFQDPKRTQFQNVLAEIDYNAGLVLDAIDEAGIRDNTIVVFASDNGPQTMFGRDIDFGAQSDPGPFRNEFPSAWEGAIRTPGIVRWPGRAEAGRVSNEIVSILDFYRTFAVAAGAAGRVPTDRAIDSIDLTDFLFGNRDKSPRDHVMFFYRDDLMAIKWRNFKMHLSVRDPATGPVVVPGQGEVHGFKKELNYPWLFNVDNDPKELWDIGSSNGWANRAFAAIQRDYAASVARFPNIKPGAERPG
jgi:arylsulfatase